MAGPLSGVRVLDLGQYIAGPLASMLLGDLGADVVRIDPPGGPRMQGPANATWNRGKQAFALDLKSEAGRERACQLIAAADVLIENFRPGVMARLGLGAGELCAANPRLIYCALPGFAGDDPRAGVAAWEGVVGAATGTYATRLEGDNGGEGAVFTAVPISSAYAAFLGATSVVMALIARERDGQGQRIEVPLFDATFTAIGARGITFHDPSAAPPPRGSAWVRQYECADGRWVQFHAANTRFILQFIKAAGVEQWQSEGLADRQRLNGDRALSAELLARMVALFKTRTAQEWEDLVNAAGTPTAICRESAEWLEHPHARGSRMIVEVEDPEYGPMLQPGVQARLLGTPGEVRPRPTAHSTALPPGDPWPRPQLTLSGNSPALCTPSSDGAVPLSALQGVKVLDLCIILAGPTCGRTLAEFGADVIKIDAPEREGGVAFHQDVNRGKRSILLDLKSNEGREVFWTLVDEAEVVVQNYRDGVVQRLGVDYEAVRRRKPRIVYASLNAYGHVGPWAQRPGWEQLAQAATGMQARYGRGGMPVLQPFPVNDYGTGIMGAYAVAAALYHRQRTGEGQHVQTALAYTACTLQSLFLQDFTGKRWDEPNGQRALGWGPLQRLYRAADGWFFLGAPEAERDRLAALAGVSGSAPLPDEAFAAALEAAFARRPRQAWVDALTAAGIGAQRTATVPELMMDGWVMAHGLSLRREHDGLGEITTNGPAPRLSRTPVRPGRPAPRPGSDARSILAEIGLADDLDGLAERGVVRLDLAAAR
ncbi:MAG TPA: CoA transferase [Dehalococcoidia bacterium]|nr:CoA transferase [Dehalococcoidia bacterium]